MTAVGDARKRQQVAQAPTTATIPAPMDSGAIGRLTEAQRADLDNAVQSALSVAMTMRKPSGHLILAAVERIVREHTDRALAEAWDAALRHVWALNDPAYTVITDTESIHPILTRRDVEQAANENPYRAARQEQGR